jgi:DNA modification methylase
METNTIYCGDNIEVMKHYIPDNSVDLIYADPPFFSNKYYEVLWGDGYELRSFEDRWKGGINNYIAWMEPRIRECQRVLKETGSFYLHCDWHANSYLRILLDTIFGENKFRNEIVWHYRRWPTGNQQFQKNHDTIYFYTKSDKGIHTFNPQYVEPTEETLKRWGKQKQRVTFDKKGQRKPTQELKEKSQGVLMPDVWTISIIAPVAKERLGYPTQKPEALLERIITVSSNPFDIVLDPFCGCGTTLAVAHRLGRRWIGIDVSPTACKLMAKRMRKIGVKEPTIIGLPRSVEELKALQPFEFQNWVFEKLHGRVNPRKVGDLGIDGWVELDVPTQVKQSENVGRVVVDRFETAIRRFGKRSGVIVAFSFTRDAYDEVARVHLLDDLNRLDIKLKTVEEILKET